MAGPRQSVLDDPVGASLRARHLELARSRGRALAYQPEIATFCAVPRDPVTQDWVDLAALLGPGGFADLFSLAVSPPPDWQPVFTLTGVQLTAPEGQRTGVDRTAEIVELGRPDVPDMLRLARRTEPGPFWAGTRLMGRYVGVRHDGELVAMAGERLKPPGWTEISAVCTSPEARGRGLASQLVDELVQGIVARGDRGFLHVSEDNPRAHALYLRLGFRVRREVRFHGYRVPSG